MRSSALGSSMTAVSLTAIPPFAVREGRPPCVAIGGRSHGLARPVHVAPDAGNVAVRRKFNRVTGRFRSEGYVCVWWPQWAHPMMVVAVHLVEHVEALNDPRVHVSAPARMTESGSPRAPCSRRRRARRPGERVRSAIVR